MQRLWASKLFSATKANRSAVAIVQSGHERVPKDLATVNAGHLSRSGRESTQSEALSSVVKTLRTDSPYTLCYAKAKKMDRL